MQNMNTWSFVTCASLLFQFLTIKYASTEDNLPFISKIYKCVNHVCVISEFRNETKESYGIDTSLDVCRLTCGPYGSLWPRPTIATTIKNSVIEFGLNNVVLKTLSVADESSKEYLSEAFRVFTSSLAKMCSPQCVPSPNTLTVSITTTAAFTNLNWSTDESYNLSVSNDNPADQITATITARTVYGARHGLETLRQLTATYRSNAAGRTLVAARDVQVTDEPSYAHRGFMLDTSRNYFPLSAIERTIDAMGHSKLNVFHWHATDSHSFPLELPSVRQMAM